MKTKPSKALLITIAADAGVYAVYKLAVWVLHQNGLTLRNTPTYIVYAVLACITLSIIVQILIILYRWARQNKLKRSLRILSGVGIVALTVATLLTAFFLMYVGVALHWPEHVIERDGKTMVAYVDSFLQVNVYYYDYGNAIVRSSYMKIREDYGNGGYDPFERDEMPTPHRIEYY